MTKNVEQIGSYNLIGAKITARCSYYRGTLRAHLWLTDEEYTRTGIRKLGIALYKAQLSADISEKDAVSATVREINFAQDGKALSVLLENEDCREIRLDIAFYSADCEEFEYEGMSCENVYEKCRLHNQRFDYIFSEEYEEKSSERDAGCGYTLRITDYSAVDESCGSKLNIYVSKGVLLKDNEEIFSYRAYDNAPVNAAQVIRHSSGREYFLFREDLYGMSVLDIASGETYNYIPAGWHHDKDYPCGESFIITDIHYDESTDLIALGGCFWACPLDVMVTDFSAPMSYDPHFTNIHCIIDPEYGETDDVEFVSWADGKLKCTGDKKPFSIDIETLREVIKSGKYTQ